MSEVAVVRSEFDLWTEHWNKEDNNDYISKQQGYWCSQCIPNNTTIAVLDARSSTFILTLTSCCVSLQLFLLQRLNQNAFSAKWRKPYQQYTFNHDRGSAWSLRIFRCIVIFYYTLLMWLHTLKKMVQGDLTFSLMHCMRYIYDFIIHFNNELGIFTVVADADDKFNSVSELVNSIMLWLILWILYCCFFIIHIYIATFRCFT